MRKILISVMMIALSVTLVFGATKAYFSDTETSNGNTFTAGTLDLNVDGGNTNSVKFTVSNMRPGNQPIGTWRLKNVGSVDGFLDLQNIVVVSQENGCNDPETEAGDTTCNSPGVGEGELQDLVSLSKLFWDTDCNGWVGVGETTIYDGKAGAIAANYETNMALNAGAEKCVTAQFNWWNNGADDNKGQGDSFTMGLTFELGQTQAQ